MQVSGEKSTILEEKQRKKPQREAHKGLPFNKPEAVRMSGREIIWLILIVTNERKILRTIGKLQEKKTISSQTSITDLVSITHANNE